MPLIGEARLERNSPQKPLLRAKVSPLDTWSPSLLSIAWGTSSGEIPSLAAALTNSTLPGKKVLATTVFQLTVSPLATTTLPLSGKRLSIFNSA